MTKKEMDRYISKLKSGEINRRQLPGELDNDEIFILRERKAKTRVFEKRGFDIVNNNYFVLEKLLYDKKEDSYTENLIIFEKFEEFYNFLNGDIYTDSYYYQYPFKEELIREYNLDISKMKNTHFIDFTIDDFNIADYIKDRQLQEDELYKAGERTRRNIIKWVDRLSACDTKESFTDEYSSFLKSKFERFRRIVETLVIQRKPDVIFEYLISKYNNSEFYDIYDIESLFTHYDINRIKDAVVFDKSRFVYSKATFLKRKKEFNAIVDRLLDKRVNDVVKNEENELYQFKYWAGYSPETHFYIVKKRLHYGEKSASIIVLDAFVTFEDFAKFLNYNLSGCDLSAANIHSIDLSECMIDEQTKLPRKKININTISADQYTYTRIVDYKEDSFNVNESWNFEGEVINKKHSFIYFGDLVYFLKGNLFNADFSLCNKLVNLNSIHGLYLEKAQLQSDFCDKFGIPYEKLCLPDINNISFAQVQQNSEDTEMILENKNELELSFAEMNEHISVSYISDIHLLHMLFKRGCKNESDCNYVINKICCSLKRTSNYLLIGGDVASDFAIFERFVEKLSVVNFNATDRVIFVLGNHELWGLEGLALEHIIEKYRCVIEKYGFSLLHNSVLYESNDSERIQIDEKQLLKMTKEELQDKFKDARLIIFGGIGFSGLNDEFNAHKGIYRNVLTRQEEMLESKKFSSLYKKVCDSANGRNLIVLSHMPKEDWSQDDYKKGVIYVSGHNHRNYFFDEDNIRIYSDNQVGYKASEVYLKNFYVGKEYDYFSSYDDNIYEITLEQYREFYRAKNILMNCNRKGKYYMLKKRGYYCFLFYGRDNFRKKTGLFLLNGGELVSLLSKDISYYFNQMDEVINILRKPLDKYSEIQRTIANQIKKIGGSGFIHGAIVDIDYFNHIYINPNDLTITPYWAQNVVYKKAYKNIPSLLKAECPMLYLKYVRSIKTDKENELIIQGNAEIDLKPVLYLETDIYRASRELKKLQRVNKGILTKWIDGIEDNRSFIE